MSQQQKRRGNGLAVAGSDLATALAQAVTEETMGRYTDLSQVLKQGGVAVVVGGRTTNFDSELRNHPRLVFWDSIDPKTARLNELPSNAKAVLITRFCSHRVFEDVVKQAKARGILVIPGLQHTGQIRAQLRQLVGIGEAPSESSNSSVEPAKHPEPVIQLNEHAPTLQPQKDISLAEEISQAIGVPLEAPSYLTKEQTLRQPRMGEIKRFIEEHADFSKPRKSEASRLLKLLNDRGVASTEDSIAQAIRQYAANSTSARAVVKPTPPSLPPPLPTTRSEPKPKAVIPPTISGAKTSEDLLTEAFAEAETYLEEITTAAGLLRELFAKARVNIERFRDRQKKIRELAAQASEFLD